MGLVFWKSPLVCEVDPTGCIPSTFQSATNNNQIRNQSHAKENPLYHGQCLNNQHVGKCVEPVYTQAVTGGEVVQALDRQWEKRRSYQMAEAHCCRTI